MLNRALLLDKLNAWAKKARADGGYPDRIWTQEIKKIFIQMASDDKNIHVCASAAGADFGEWLFDVTWVKYSGANFGRPMKKLLLAVESEWGNAGDVMDDFEKLLVCRAESRVMIFDSTKGVEPSLMIKEMTDYAKEYDDYDPKDCFIFAYYRNGEGEFEVVEWP